ncbi:MAG: hypothetical protein AAF499_14365, partial [Pseudomonadota bacterium]
MPALAQAQGHRPNQAEITAKFEAIFGADALASVQNADGSVNVDSVKTYLQDQGIQHPGQIASMQSGATPFSDALGQVNSERLLDTFTTRFGEDAASQISNDDGSLNFAKMGEYIQSQKNEALPNTFASIANFDTSAIEDRIVGQFGEDALAAVTDASGNIDPAKVKDFMMEKVQSGEISPPFGGGFGIGGAG